MTDHAHRHQAEDRRRRHWLLHQAAESTTWVHVLTDLAERAVPVSVHTAAGPTTPAPLHEVGSDFVVVRIEHGALRLVPTAAITSVRSPEPTVDGSGSWLCTAPALTLAERLQSVAADHRQVAVAAGEERLAGTLRRVGRDILTIRTGHGDTVHVRLGAVVDVVLW